MLAEIKTTEQDGKKDYASLIENLARLLQHVKEVSVPDQSSAPRPPVRKSAGGDARYRPAGGKIGGLLVERGFARPEDIATALLEQEKGDRRRLGEILVSLGLVRPEDILAAQQILGDSRARDAKADTI